MTTYARIQSGLVAELFTTTGDITTMFNPALVWVPVGTSGAQVGWTYSGGAFSAPVPLPPLAKPQLIAYAMAKVATLLAASRPYTVAGVAGTISCDCGPSAANVSEALQWGSATPAPTGMLPWLDNTYAAFSLTAAQATAFGNAVGAYKISVFAVSTPAVTSIMGGTITTTTQIDALAWPT